MSIDIRPPHVTEAEADDGSALLEHFETALRRDAANADAWLALGLTHMYHQRTDQAVQALSRAAELLHHHPDALVALGWAQLMAEDCQGSRESFEHACRADAHSAQAHGGLAMVLILQGETLRAQAKLKLALALDPESFEAGVAMAALLDVDGRGESAAAALSRLLARPVTPDRNLH